MPGLWSQLWRFGVSGVAALVVDAALLYLMLAAGLGYFGGRAVSFLAAVWVTWQVNRRFTFRAQAQRASWDEWWRYLAAMAGGGAINYGAYTLAVLLLPRSSWTGLYGVAIGSAAGALVNFLSARAVIARPPP
ncbi:MAG: GtrA family protein [Pseudomonadota bacterium]